MSGETTSPHNVTYPEVVDADKPDPSSLDDKTLEDLNLTRLADGLERYVRNLGAPPISILTQLEDRWPEIVGPGLAVSTRPVELTNGVLTIACADGAGASQVGWMETQIIQRFGSTFNTNIVERVISRVDR